MKNEEIILTEDGVNKVKDELTERKTIIRKKIADEIELARQQGDLSENAAYHAAMKDKEFNDTRIDQLEDTLKYAVVKKSNPKNKTIDLGENFILENISTKKKVEYKLVGANEANPAERKISINSPIGSKVMGKDYGDKVTVTLPSGEVEFKVLKAK